MATFFERNKRKSVLALLLLFLKWRKGLAPMLLIVALLMLMSFAPGNLMGICLSGLARVPGGSYLAAGITWSASKAGLEIGGVPHQDTFAEYLSAFRLAGQEGFAGLLQKRSFKDLIDAFRMARDDRGAAMALLNGGGAGQSGSGLDMLRGGADGGSAGAIAERIARSGGQSVSGVLNPKDAKQSDQSVSLDEADLEGERAGMVASAFGGGFDSGLNPDGYLGGSGAYASKAFFGTAGAMGAAGAFGKGAKSGSGGSHISNFSNGLSSQGGNARLARAAVLGGQAMNLGRFGTKSSMTMGTLRGMSSVNSSINGATTNEEAAGDATQQWEGSELTGSQAQIPDTPPSLGGASAGQNDGGTGSFGGIPGGSGSGAGGVTPPPTSTPADPGIVCTSAQLAQGWVSNGQSCVSSINTGTAGDVAGYGNDENNIQNEILRGFALTTGGFIAIGIGMGLIETGSPCAMAIGVGILIGGLGLYAAGMSNYFQAMSNSVNLMGKGGGVEGGLYMATALGLTVSSLIGLFLALGGPSTVGLALTNNVASLVGLIGLLMVGMQKLVGGTAPQQPQVENPVSQQQQQDAQLNAQTTGPNGQAAPPNMHFETVNGQPTLEYDYNTFPPGQEPSPSVAQALDSQTGGGGTGLPVAPAGEHYEGLNSSGQPNIVPNYPTNVAAEEDANSFTGGSPTQLSPAPSGEHYEQTNSGGDPTSPSDWTLVPNYNIPPSQIAAANANAGQPGSASAAMGCSPAPAGEHYEGSSCSPVKNYPTSN